MQLRCSQQGLATSWPAPKEKTRPSPALCAHTTGSFSSSSAAAACFLWWGGKSVDRGQYCRPLYMTDRAALKHMFQDRHTTTKKDWREIGSHFCRMTLSAPPHRLGAGTAQSDEPLDPSRSAGERITATSSSSGRVRNCDAVGVSALQKITQAIAEFANLKPFKASGRRHANSNHASCAIVLAATAHLCPPGAGSWRLLWPSAFSSGSPLGTPRAAPLRDGGQWRERRSSAIIAHDACALLMRVYEG